MSSKCVTDLYQIADQLEQDGKPSTATTCREAGKRMEVMEDIVLGFVLVAAKEGN